MQTDELFRLFDKEQVFITTLDRLKNNELEEFNRVLRFLGVPEIKKINQKEQVRYNKGAVPRSILLQRAAYYLRFVKLGRLMNLIYKWNLKDEKHPPMQPEMREKLEKELAEDSAVYNHYNQQSH